MNKDYIRAALSLIAPNRCPFCGEMILEFEYWHEECYLALPLYNETKIVPNGLSEFHTVCCYEGLAKRAIIELKKGMSYAADSMALLMTEAMGGAEYAAGAVFVPVPSSFKSILYRGYQPAKCIAKYMARCCKIPVITALKAADEKTGQKTLNAEQRKINARTAFLTTRSAKRVKGKRVILVDDICTTGSTLSACAKLLRQAGAADVVGVTFAKTRRQRRRKRTSLSIKTADTKQSDLGERDNPSFLNLSHYIPLRFGEMLKK